jgi:hypothetical protein
MPRDWIGFGGDGDNPKVRAAAKPCRKRYVAFRTNSAIMALSTGRPADRERSEVKPLIAMQADPRQAYPLADDAGALGEREGGEEWL